MIEIKLNKQIINFKYLAWLNSVIALLLIGWLTCHPIPHWNS